MDIRLQRAEFGSTGVIGVTVIAMVLASTGLARAQVSYNSLIGVPYSQTFDTLTKSGSTTFLQNSTILGWYAHRSGSGTSIAPDNGSTNAGNLYSFGSTGGDDRALGSVGSVTPGDFVWAVRIQNSTGLTITGFTVQYTGEQWRDLGVGAQTVEFGYGIFDSVSGPSVATLLAPGAAAFTDVDAMHFTSPITSGTVTQLDGNNAANRRVLSATINATIPAGQELWLRWNDINHTGNDHALATDDFSFAATSFQPVPTPPAALSLGIGVITFLSGTRLRRRRANKRRNSGNGSDQEQNGSHPELNRL